MRKFFLFCFMAICLTCTWSSERYSDLYHDLPFDMPMVNRPQFPALSVCLTDFGGKGDGQHLNTKAFKMAIHSLASRGGGRLVVPQGVWLTGPIVLEDNIDLHLSDNSIILFTQDKSLYPIVKTVFEGSETFRCQPQISAVGKRNIAITGAGIIDGAGDIWRLGRKAEMPPSVWQQHVQSGGILSEDGEQWYPSESYYRGAKDATQNIVPWAKTMADFKSIRDFLRPVMIHIRGCEGVLLEGVTFQNSPCWNVHLALCRNLVVDGIVVRCPWYAKNGDGIDIESCINMLLVNSKFDVGDDAICIKSGKDAEGRARGIPAANIIVDNCVCFHGHGGFVVGSEMSGGVKNISVSNCRFSGTDVGLRFKSKRGRGGVVENIYIRDIMMNDIVTEALLFDLFYAQQSASELLANKNSADMPNETVPEADETTPQFRNVFVSRIVCHGARRAMFFNGLPEMNIDKVLVEDSYIVSKKGIEICETKDVELRNVTLVAEEKPALSFHNVKGAVVEDFSPSTELEGNLKISGHTNRDILINGEILSEQWE